MEQVYTPIIFIPILLFILTIVIVMIVKSKNND